METDEVLPGSTLTGLSALAAAGDTNAKRVAKTARALTTLVRAKDGDAMVWGNQRRFRLWDFASVGVSGDVWGVSVEVKIYQFIIH